MTNVHHFVYGLTLSASQLIPGLASSPVARRPEVQIWLGSKPPCWGRQQEINSQILYCGPHKENGAPLLTVRKVGPYFHFAYADGTEFFLDLRGTQIWAIWPNRATLEDTATYLLGPVLAFVLRLRGIICLHASAVAIGQCAIALLGSPGSGKSTTAAAFARRGYPVFSDDVVPLVKEGENFMVQPGYPRLCLWPHAADILYGSAEVLPQVTPNWEKRYVDLSADACLFQRNPLPLGAMYVFDVRAAGRNMPRVEMVPAQRRLLHLVSNTHCNYMLTREMRAQEFETLSRVAGRIPLRLVHPHENPRFLDKLCDVILDDFCATPQTVSTTSGQE
jgi:hypothetical protein